MELEKARFGGRRRILAASVGLAAECFIGGGFRVSAQAAEGFPDGYDAVQVAPGSHRVLFENQFVRVLEVVVAPGMREPMHHHRWASMFVYWDTGGRTAHQRIYHGDGTVHDIPSVETPVTGGVWRVRWMKPEPMHSVENLETPEAAATRPRKPPTLRVEFKTLA